MKKKLQNILEETFGLESFREGQQGIIENVISGNHSLVFMPTGGGKSLTYQLPGVLLEGVCIVISPLISLMKDQIDSLTALGIKAKYINSTISSGEVDEILDELSETRTNPIKFLYIAPERLNSPKFMRVITNIKVSLVAIDEAHCISQWGHDFRPSYMKIKGFIEALLGEFPIIALTATATHKVREDIVERLGITKYTTYVKGFDRKNITVVVREISAKTEKMQKLLEILDKTPGSGIIYCSSRKVVKEIYDMLCEYKIKTGMYMGSMTPEVRESMQDKFMNDDYKVIVATNAFGMGIDKKDIRFVIHYNLPGSIENYYQEVGRAGRDGKQSFGVVLASYGDTKIQEFFIENTYPDKKDILDLYDYLYQGITLGNGKGTEIIKTYRELAAHSSVESDMKVGSIIKILEKYGIIHRGMGHEVEGFRGRGVTLSQEKRQHAHLLVDWERQEALKQEAYYKLEQIKRLLFYPSCRKRFILEYFGDEEDLKDLGENCKACDFCIDQKEFIETDMKTFIHISTFSLILETVKQYNEKFGAKLIGGILGGSSDKRILQWKLDDYEDYAALSDYSTAAVSAMIDALIFEEYLYRTSGKYPLIGITELGLAVLYRDKALKEALEDLNRFVIGKVGVQIHKKASSKKRSSGKKTNSSGSTYAETLDIFKSFSGEKGLIDYIAQKREMTPITIEGHIVKLYEDGRISLMEILNIIEFENIKKIKKIIKEKFEESVDKLRPIKDELENIGEKKISYFDIKIAIAMIEKGDI